MLNFNDFSKMNMKQLKALKKSSPINKPNIAFTTKIFL